jgi:hypothetical protein
MTEQAVSFSIPSQEQTKISADAITKAGQLLIIGNPRINPSMLSPELQALHKQLHQETTIKTPEEVVALNIRTETAYDQGFLRGLSSALGTVCHNEIIRASLVKLLTITQSDMILLEAGVVRGDENSEQLLKGKEAAYKWILGHNELPGRILLRKRDLF